jgi:hypothetical protein
MKTLNRPMFRYGGPIKEGVMNGIREPKRNGGVMGTRKAALVGNPMFPQTDGRAHHALPLMIPMAVGAAARFAAPLVGNFVRRRMPKLLKDGAVNINKKGITKFKPRKFDQEGFEPNRLGKFFVNDPLAKAAVAGSGVAGKAVKGIYNTAKYATTTPSGLLFLGAPVTVAAGRYFLADGKELKGDDLNKIKKGGVNTPSGNNPFGYEDDVKTTPEGEKELTLAEREALEAKSRMDQMDKYREIIDIKGMNKDAAYKSLIDASKIIQEGGNLKKSLKDGSLISKVTAAASKRFDKVNDTENALRSLVVKGEIDNELNKVDKDLKRRALEGTIAVNDKKLAGASLGETVNDVYSKTGKFPTGKNLANVARTKGIQVVGIEDTTVVDDWIGENGGDEVTYMQDVISRGIEVAPGPHVLRSRIILVDSEGNVSPYF